MGASSLARKIVSWLVVLLTGVIIAFFVATGIYGMLWGFSPWIMLIPMLLVGVPLGFLGWALCRPRTALGYVGAIGTLVGPSIAIIGLFLMTLTAQEPDLTCHNPLRGGQRSIAAVSSLSVTIPPKDWPELVKLLEDVDARGGWQSRYDVRLDQKFEWLQISLCREPGTVIQASGASDLGVVYVSLYLPQGSVAVPEFDQLKGELSKRWPTESLGIESTIRNTT